MTGVCHHATVNFHSGAYRVSDIVDDNQYAAYLMDIEPITLRFYTDELKQCQAVEQEIVGELTFHRKTKSVADDYQTLRMMHN